MSQDCELYCTATGLGILSFPPQHRSGNSLRFQSSQPRSCRSNMEQDGDPTGCVSSEDSFLKARFVNIPSDVVKRLIKPTHQEYLQRTGLERFVKDVPWSCQKRWDREIMKQFIINFNEGPARTSVGGQSISLSEDFIRDTFCFGPGGGSQVDKKCFKYVPLSWSKDGRAANGAYDLSWCKNELVQERLIFQLFALHMRRAKQSPIWCIRIAEEAAKKDWGMYFTDSLIRDLRGAKKRYIGGVEREKPHDYFFTSQIHVILLASSRTLIPSLGPMRLQELKGAEAPLLANGHAIRAATTKENTGQKNIVLPLASPSVDNSVGVGDMEDRTEDLGEVVEHTNSNGHGEVYNPKDIVAHADVKEQEGVTEQTDVREITVHDSGIGHVGELAFMKCEEISKGQCAEADVGASLFKEHPIKVGPISERVQDGTFAVDYDRGEGIGSEAPMEGLPEHISQSLNVNGGSKANDSEPNTKSSMRFDGLENEIVGEVEYDNAKGPCCKMYCIQLVEVLRKANLLRLGMNDELKKVLSEFIEGNFSKSKTSGDAIVGMRNSKFTQTLTRDIVKKIGSNDAIHPDKKADTTVKEVRMQQSTMMSSLKISMKTARPAGPERGKRVTVEAGVEEYKPSKRVKWTHEQTECLKKAVVKFGEGKWALMKAHYPDAFRNIVREDGLKDKWRNIKKAGNL